MKKEIMYLNPSHYVGENGEDIQNYIEVTYDEFGRLNMDGHKLYFAGEEPLENDEIVGKEILNPDGKKLIANEGWSNEDLKTIKDIWDKWDVNYGYAYDEEMARLGWDKLAKKPIFEIEFKLKGDLSEEKRELSKKIGEALRETGTVTLSEEEQRLYKMKPRYTVYSYEKIDSSAVPEGYMLRWTNKTALGEVFQKDHPDGLIGKLCESSGNKYGEKTYTHELPSEVLNILWANSIPLERKVLQGFFPATLCENAGGYPDGTKNIIKIPNGVEIDGRDIGGCYIKPERSYKATGDEVYIAQAVDPMQKGRIALYHPDGEKEYVPAREFFPAVEEWSKNKELGIENSYKKEKEYEPEL